MSVDRTYRKHRTTFLFLGNLSKWLQHKATCSVCSGYVQLTAAMDDPSAATQVYAPPSRVLPPPPPPMPSTSAAIHGHPLPTKWAGRG